MPLPAAKARTSQTVLLLFVLVASALPYLPALRYSFAYDDDAQIVSDFSIRNWHNLSAYFVTPAWKMIDPSAANNYYRPLFYVWLQANYALFKLHPFAWHLTSLAVHLAVTLLLFFLLLRSFRQSWIAAAGALVFALHPVHIESVVWVSGVTDPLATLGVVGSLLLWLRSAESHRARRLAAALLCYLAALLVKEPAIVLPAIVFVYSLAGQGPGTATPEPATGRLRLAVNQSIPFLCVTAAYLALRIVVLKGLGGGTGGAPWISARDTFLTAPKLLVFYLWHLVWPVKLSIFYALPIVTSARSAAFVLSLAALGIIAVAGVILWRRRRTPNIPIAFTWLVLPILPVLKISVFQVDDFLHDRYLYLPCVGLAILFCVLLQSLTSENVPARPSWKLALAVRVVVVLLGLATVFQETPWRDNVALFTYALERTPNNTIALNNLCVQYAAQGRYQEAHDLLVPVIRQRPDYWVGVYNFGYVNYRLGRLDVAEQYLRRAISINERNADEHGFLGQTYLRENRLADAAAQFNLALHWRPDGRGYHFALGLIAMQQGDLNKAQAELREELQSHPDSLAAVTELAFVQRLAQAK